MRVQESYLHCTDGYYNDDDAQVFYLAYQYNWRKETVWVFTAHTYSLTILTKLTREI